MIAQILDDVDAQYQKERMTLILQSPYGRCSVLLFANLPYPSIHSLFLQSHPKHHK